MYSYTLQILGWLALLHPYIHARTLAHIHQNIPHQTNFIDCFQVHLSLLYSKHFHGNNLVSFICFEHCVHIKAVLLLTTLRQLVPLPNAPLPKKFNSSMPWSSRVWNTMCKVGTALRMCGLANLFMFRHNVFQTLSQNVHIYPFILSEIAQTSTYLLGVPGRACQCFVVA